MNAGTDTAIEAHVRLPALGWGEKDGTVTNSERRISRQRAFLSPPGEARADWWIVADVARRMGFGGAFNYAGPAEIFAEHVGLTAFENDGSRDLDLGGLVGVNYDELEPVQWPVREAGTQRLFGDGHFFRPGGRAKFVPVAPPPPLLPSPGRLILNTGRVRDHWHTMTRTGKSARLSAHLAEPFAELHPDDASRLGIKRATLVRIENRNGAALARALITDRQRRGSVFVPMHWTDQFASSARIDALVAGKTDPQSGQPALKMAEATVAPARVGSYGYAVSRLPPDAAGTLYWATARTAGGYRTELAWEEEPRDWEREARRLFARPAGQALLSARDERSGRHSFAAFSDGRLEFVLYVSAEPVLVSRQWAAELLPTTFEHASRRVQVLAGRPAADMPDPGPIVCACFSVGTNSIADAARRGCASVADVGVALKAGTNCGSCRTEIQAILVQILGDTANRRASDPPLESDQGARKA